MSGSEASQAPFDGDLSERDLASVLQRLGQDKVTGILTVQSDEDIMAISFEEGLIVGADALNETLEDGLGKALTDEGLLSQEQFSSVLGRVRSERGRLGDILPQEGMLPRPDYLAALRRYTVVLVRRSCSWDRGTFKFYEGDEVSYEEGFEPVRVEEVVSAEGHIAEGALDESEVLVQSGLGELEGPVDDLGSDSGVVVESDSRPVSPYGAPQAGARGLGGLRGRLLHGLDDAAGWLTWLVPSLVALILAGVVLLGPNLLVYPFFWLEPERLEFEKQRRSSVYLKIDRAAKTFFLLEGRFPDDLHALVARGLLSNRDIVGSRGRILAYLPGDRGYVIKSAVMDGTDPGVIKTEAIAGDFFLDPEFVILAPQTESIPLVLLD